MKTVNRKYLKLIDSKNFGIVALATAEINPRSGPPDAVISGTTDEGFLDDWQAGQGWEPKPHQRTVFGMFLLSPNRSIVLSKVSDERHLIEYDADFVRTALGPLSGLDAKSVPGWDTVGTECSDQNHVLNDDEGSDEPE